MNSKKIRRLVMTALFTAIVCVATMVIRIPSPVNGYVNMGDCFVLLSGWLLGPAWGFFAGGVGAMLADILSGYAQFAPATLIIKGLMALVASLLFTALTKAAPERLKPARLLSGAVAECIMVSGYFGYAALLLGNGLGAAAGIPGDMIQGGVGLLCGFLLASVLPLTRKEIFQ